MSYELVMQYYQHIQEILANNIFQEYGIIGLFLNSLLAATAIPLPTRMMFSPPINNADVKISVGNGIAVAANNEFKNKPIIPYS